MSLCPHCKKHDDRLEERGYCLHCRADAPAPGAPAAQPPEPARVPERRAREPRPPLVLSRSNFDLWIFVNYKFADGNLWLVCFFPVIALVGAAFATDFVLLRILALVCCLPFVVLCAIATLFESRITTSCSNCGTPLPRSFQQFKHWGHKMTRYTFACRSCSQPDEPIECECSGW
jgi:hypothetical protein